MDKRKIIYVAGVAALIYIIMGTQKAFGRLTSDNTIRPADPYGSGAYGASRSHGKHQGVDILVNPGQDIKCPVDGKITRIAYPYAGDTDYKGFVLVSGPYEIKIFYANLSVSVGSTVKKGQVIATAQNISAKYSSSMANHVHFEVRKNGILINPTNLFE